MLLHAPVLLLIGALCIFSGFKTFAQADPVGAIRSSTVETPEGEDTAFHYVFETCKNDQENMTVQVDKLSGSEGIPSWVRAMGESTRIFRKSHA